MVLPDFLLPPYSSPLASSIPGSSGHGGLTTYDLRARSPNHQNLPPRRPALFPRGKSFRPSISPTWIPQVVGRFRADSQAQIQNTRVRDMEWEVPLPAHPTIPNAPDLSIVQRAWWDVISLVYADAADSKVPMRLTLELRIMGGSDMIMAPQRGNDYGTASIEVLTVPGAAPTMEEWEQFKQKVADVWMSYEGAGGKVNSRPHWAKEWYVSYSSILLAFFILWLANIYINHPTQAIPPSVRSPYPPVPKGARVQGRHPRVQGHAGGDWQNTGLGAGGYTEALLESDVG